MLCVCVCAALFTWLEYYNSEFEWQAVFRGLLRRTTLIHLNERLGMMLILSNIDPRNWCFCYLWAIWWWLHRKQWHLWMSRVLWLSLFTHLIASFKILQPRLLSLKKIAIMQKAQHHRNVFRYSNALASFVRLSRPLFRSWMRIR